MEIIQEVIEDTANISNEKKEEFAKKIKDLFDKWDEDRQQQIDDAKAIMEEVYLQAPIAKSDSKDEDSWKSDVRLNKLYSIKKARTAAIWREVWSNPAQMFEVRGTNKETEENAKLQKASIVDSLEMMKIGRQYDEAIKNYFDVGEMIFITDWKKKTKVVKRQKKGIGFVLYKLSRVFNIETNGKHKEIELPYYDNARVRAVHPFMFVFDHSNYEIGEKESWDSCIKIYKRFETPEAVKANKAYTLTKEQEEFLKRDTSHNTDDNKSLADLRNESSYGNKHEVLYCHGDFNFNGKLYKNYIAEVLAGKYLIRFEKNPLFINPFIFCAPELDPYTKRGISPLKSAYRLCKEQEKTVNADIDMQQLSLNPPAWVNEDLIDEGQTDIKIYPGKLLKYKNSYDGTLPQSLTLGYQNNLSSTANNLETAISNVSNANANMHGNITPAKRTATELSLADKGASATVSKELDIMNQDAVIPVIENVAELNAMFKDGSEYIYVKEKGHNIEYEITNTIREAQYKYIYEDRNAINDRKSKFQELYQLFQSVAQDPQMREMINWREVIETAVEMVGFDNSEKFFNEQKEDQLNL